MRALLAERRDFLVGADSIATFAREMSDVLKTCELVQTGAFVSSLASKVRSSPGRSPSCAASLRRRRVPPAERLPQGSSK